MAFRAGWSLGLAAMMGSVVGCATIPPAPNPALVDVTAAERAVAADSSDLDASGDLAARYLLAGQADDALTLGRALRARFPAEPTPVLVLALAHEQRFDTLEARDALQAYLRSNGAVVDRARGRLDRIERDAFRLDLRAIARGAASYPNLDPGRVAVIPFSPSGDTAATSLAAGLARLIAADLGITGRLTAIEPWRVAAALEQVAPDPVRWADPGTAEAVGRLLGAGRVVHGALRIAEDQQITIEAHLTSARDAGSTTATLLPRSGPLVGVFELTRPLMETLHGLAGVELDASQMEAIHDMGAVRRSPNDVLAPAEYVGPRGLSVSAEAWLAVGRGLVQENRGRYAEANEKYEDAFTLDPNFLMAHDHALEAAALAASASPPGELVWIAAQMDRQLRSVYPGRFGVADPWSLRALGADQRALLAEITGRGLGSGTPIEIEFEAGEVVP